jgi:hypothetical protein
LHRSDRWEAPVRPVWPELQDEQHPQVKPPKSNSRSPESLHRFAKDFRDSGITSWALHSQDLVHQYLLNREESKKFNQECL